MAHPAGKELRNSSTTTENSLIEPTVLLQNIQFTQEENSKAEHLRPRFPLFQNSVLPIGLQSFWRCFVHVAFKNSTFKTGLSKNILKPEKIPNQGNEHGPACARIHGIFYERFFVLGDREKQIC